MPAKANNNKSFPYKLYSLLEEANAQGFDDIVSWQPQGKSFIVHQPKVFVQTILPQKFKQTKFKSFLRQLNIYGFSRIQHGPNKGGYAHPHLIQGYPELLNMIKRISAPDANTSKAKDAVANVGLKPVISQVRKRSEMTPSTHGFQQQQQQQSNIPHTLSNLSSLSDFLKGSTGSLGSLGSLGMGSITSAGGNSSSYGLGEAAAPPSGAQNEAFDLTAHGMPSLEPPYPATVAAGGPLPAAGAPAGGDPNQLAFGRPFQSLPRNGGGSMLSLLSNLSNISSGTNSALNMTGSELNLFKDVFKPKDLANDVPSLATSGATQQKQNATFPSTSAPGAASKEYITSSGFLGRKPGLFEPSTTDLLGLVQGEKNEDLNRSESVFPTKLHRMLSDAKRDGFEQIVSWIHGGTAFKVHDVNAFMNKIMPIYFDQTKFESFRRQLNLYGFSRVTRGPSRGMYYHEHFVQNDPSLCQHISRPKSVRKRKKSDNSPATVPSVEAVAVA